MDPSRPTQFERFVDLLLALPLWLKLLIVLVLLGAPFALARLEGVQLSPPVRVNWRTAVFPVVAIGYLLAVTPWIWRTERKVADGLRPLVIGDPEHYGTLSSRVWWRSSLGDWMAFAIGFLGGISLISEWMMAGDWYWVERYVIATYLVLYGFSVWLIYVAVSSACLTALRHRYIQHEDPFDLTCFEPVGWQGLVLALIFIGGVAVSLFFADLRGFFSHWQTWVIYSILVLSALLVFFVVMWPTHRTLQRVKFQKLAEVQQAIGVVFQSLQASTAGSADTHLAIEFQTRIMQEQRLKQTRTWPYDTEMLRILFISVLTPLFLAISRAITTLITEGRLKLW
jgi:hypothetical protein